jgi:hypothetical protein
VTSLLLVLAASSLAEPLIVQVDGGHVDWGRGVLVAHAASSGGSGPLSSHRTLEQEAWLRLEALLTELAGTVQVTADIQADQMMAGDDPLALRLQEGLQTWRVTTARYRRSGQVELEAELVLRDWLRPALSGWASPQAPVRQAGGPTGLVVDARGLSVTPAMVPRLLAPDKTVIFGPDHLATGQLSERAPVVYVTDPADPLAAAQAGASPTFASATAVRHGSDLVLDPRDAAAFAELAPLLAWGRIVFVVDP